MKSDRTTHSDSEAISEGQFRPKLQLRLWMFLVFVAVVGAAFALLRVGQGALAVFVVIPFATGLVVGEVMPRRGKLNQDAVGRAPLLAAIVVCVVVAPVYTFGVSTAHVRGHLAPIAAQTLVAYIGAMFFLPAFFVVGAIPAIAGTLVAQWLKGNANR